MYNLGFGHVDLEMLLRPLGKKSQVGVWFENSEVRSGWRFLNDHIAKYVVGMNEIK